LAAEKTENRLVMIVSHLVA